MQRHVFISLALSLTCASNGLSEFAASPAGSEACGGTISSNSTGNPDGLGQGGYRLDMLPTFGLSWLDGLWTSAPAAEVMTEAEEATTQGAIIGRHIFYNNSYYDGNNAAIQFPGPGTHDDDRDAIDPSKRPLMAGDGTATFWNWTGYNRGINGLIYFVQNSVSEPEAADFTFTNRGRYGTSTSLVNCSGFVVQPTDDPAVACVILTFSDGLLKDCWIEVAIGTGFGLPVSETHWWGNAAGDTGAGNAYPYILVDANDEVMCRPPYLHNAFNRAPVDDWSDLNKDSLVGPDDEVLTRPVLLPRWPVKMITR